MSKQGKSVQSNSWLYIILYLKWMTFLLEFRLWGTKVFSWDQILLSEKWETTFLKWTCWYLLFFLFAQLCFVITHNRSYMYTYVVLFLSVYILSMVAWNSHEWICLCKLLSFRTWSVRWIILKFIEHGTLKRMT